MTNWCYWSLRHAGATAEQVTARLSGATIADKNELLFSHGVNYNDTPAWQRRGVALHWQRQELAGEDPRTGEQLAVTRRRSTTDTDLPRGEAFRGLVRQRLLDTEPQKE